MIDLSCVHFKEFLDATDMSFNKIDIKGTYLTDPLLLGLTGFENEQRIPLNKNHFANKESARLIKAHFEKQNNVTEANKYFVIEQDKYIDELWNNTNHEDKRITKLIPICLNKLVSNFGTNWIRGILFLFIFGIISDSLFQTLKYKANVTFDYGLLVALIGSLIAYYATFIKVKLKIKDAVLVFMPMFICLIWLFLFSGIDNLNYIVKIINPINAFKDDEIFKNYEFFGVITRVFSATIIYQIIVAFRQFTRRS